MSKSKRFAKETDYPLTWPDHFPRSKSRKVGQFRSTLAAALDNVKAELARFAKASSRKVEDVVFSSNYSLGDSNPEDPGFALWFNFDGERTCIPMDRYTRIEQNVQAAFRVLEADRTKLRHGGLHIIKADFRGRLALAPPVKAANWRKFFGYSQSQTPTLAQVKTLRNRRAQEARDDNEQLVEINVAYEAAKKELK